MCEGSLLYKLKNVLEKHKPNLVSFEVDKHPWRSVPLRLATYKTAHTLKWQYV